MSDVVQLTTREGNTLVFAGDQIVAVRLDAHGIATIMLKYGFQHICTLQGDDKGRLRLALDQAAERRAHPMLFAERTP